MKRSPTHKTVLTDAGNTLTLWDDPSIGDTVPQMFWRRVRQGGDRAAVAERRDGAWRPVAWADLGRRARHIGLGLKALGFGRHDVAAVLPGGGADGLAAQMAVLGVAGAVLDAPDGHRATCCKAVFALDPAHRDVASALRAANPELIVIAADGLADLMARGGQYDRDHLGQWEQLVDLARAGETAVIDGCSGATYSHRALVFMCVNASRLLGLGEGDAFVALPDRHSPLIDSCLAIYAAAVGHPGAALPALAEVRPALAIVPGELVASADLRRLGLDRCRRLVCRGAPSHPARAACRALGLNLLQAWGPAEAAGLATCAEAASAQPGSIGRAVPFAELKLSDAGEVLLRGGHLFAGYRDDPAATAAVLRDGWLRTGIIARIGADGDVVPVAGGAS